MTVPGPPSTDPLTPITDPAEPFKFADGSHEGPIEEVVWTARALELINGSYASKLHSSCLSAWAKDGQDQRRRCKEFAAVTSKDCNPLAVGHHFDLSVPGRARVRSIADRRVKSGRGPWFRDFLQEKYQGGADAYPDQGILHQLEFGLRFNADTSWSIAFNPPLKSALPHLKLLHEQLLAEEGQGFYTRTTRVVALPSTLNSIGAAINRGKVRVTTDNSSPRDELDPEGRPYAVNGALPPAGEEDDDIRWTGTRHSLEQCEFVYALWLLVSADLPPEQAEALRPRWFAVDAKAFFRQFEMCMRDQHLQTLIFPAKEETQIFTSPRLAFGSRFGPELAQRIAYLMDTVVKLQMQKWIHLVLEIRTHGHQDPEIATAAREALPDKLLAWARRRAASQGKEMTSVLGELIQTLQYIDDRQGGGLGEAMPLACMFASWDLASSNQTDLPVSAPKSQYGHSLEYLGIVQHGGFGLATITKRRLGQLDEILVRMKTLPSIERKELDSNLGKYGFAAQIQPPVQALLARSYRTLHQ